MSLGQIGFAGDVWSTKNHDDEDGDEDDVDDEDKDGDDHQQEEEDHDDHDL